MVVVEINGEEYNICNDWKDFTNETAIEVYRAISNMPTKLNELYRCTSQEQIEKVELSNEDMIKAFPQFYGEVLCLLSDIPESVMNKTLSGDRVAIYKTYVENIILGLMYMPEGIEPIEEFEWNGKTYKLPKSKTVVGDYRIGAYMTAMEFAEAADLEYFATEVSGGKYEYAPNILGILCREEGKEYNEDESLARAELFRDLPMDIVMGVFFSLVSSTSISIRDMAVSLVPQDSKLRKRLEKLISTDSDGMVASLDYAMETTQR